jgi:lipopolysaccharide biosynthesis protein
MAMTDGVLRTYWTVRDSLAPRNTARRRIYDTGIKAVRVLFTEGPGGVWWRIKQRLPGRAHIQPVGRISAGSTGPASYAEVYRKALDAAGRQGDEFVPLRADGLPAGSAPVRLIAFYLPQFHPIPENDEWWGRGFTEWTNVSKALPQFVGHYQPRLPGELGYYDLRVPEIQRRQVELARMYGLHGFCFYYYWFHGKRLLERPLEQFLSDPEIDFPFCLCWANENWTRRWDGRDQEVLIGQEHTEESDSAFIRDVEPVLRHRNYIRIHGRPLLIVYRAQILPNPAATAKRWRKYCREAGVGEPYLVAAQTFGFTDPREVGFDAAVEFPPHNCALRDIHRNLTFLNPDFDGRVYHYRDVIRQLSRSPRAAFPVWKTVFTGWDNEPRTPGRGQMFAFSTPGDYQEWLAAVGRIALKNPDPEMRLVFINAWNEWAEGTYLEPDRRFGYAYLDATAKALQSL